jgi:branched-subunit amino acid transport protein
MPWTDFAIILTLTAAATLLSRILPVATLAGRRIPARLEQALRYIPVAAFCALVANDLFVPERLALGLAANLMPVLALAPVVIVSLRWRSLWLAIVTGCASFALLSWLPSVL